MGHLPPKGVDVDICNSDFGDFDEILDAQLTGDAERLRSLGEGYRAGILTPARLGGSLCPNVAAALLELCRYCYAGMVPQRKSSPVVASERPRAMVDLWSLPKEDRAAIRAATDDWGF